MPRYDYECKVCAASFEIDRGMNDMAHDLQCPSCHSPQVHRLYGGISLGGRTAAPARAESAPAAAPVKSSVGGCGSGCGHKH